MGFFVPAGAYIADAAKAGFILKHQPNWAWDGKSGLFLS
jgi:hypothetical protein